MFQIKMLLFAAVNDIRSMLPLAIKAVLNNMDKSIARIQSTGMR